MFRAYLFMSTSLDTRHFDLIDAVHQHLDRWWSDLMRKRPRQRRAAPHIA